MIYPKDNQNKKQKQNLSYHDKSHQPAGYFSLDEDYEKFITILSKYRKKVNMKSMPIA